MKLLFFLLPTPALFTAAIPMMSFGEPGAPSTPEPPPPGSNQVPKVDFGHPSMTRTDKKATTNLIIDHYKGLEPWNDQKQAKLAFAQNGWIDGMLPNDHQQYLNFDYHRGNTPDSPKIGQTITVSRDRPPPEPHFSNAVLSESKPDIIKEMNKKYKALPPDVAGRVRSMRAQNDWADGPGLREETQITFHKGPIPLVYNTIGNPVTVYRPMSFLIDDDVPKDHIPTIKRRVREEHEKLDENHPLKQANYGVVNEGWHRVGKSRSRKAEAKLFKVKDQLSCSAEKDFERIGDFHVTLGRGLKPTAKALSWVSRKKLKASASVPDSDVSNLEAPSPSL